MASAGASTFPCGVNSEFLFFKDVSLGKILNVEQAAPGHFYWPDLDVDLGVETIENPDRFPLLASVEP